MKTPKLKQENKNIEKKDTQYQNAQSASLLKTKEKLFLCQKEYEITRSFEGQISLRELAKRIARMLLEEENQEQP